MSSENNGIETTYHVIAPCRTTTNSHPTDLHATTIKTASGADKLGRGLFSSQPILKGSVVLAERPAWCRPCVGVKHALLLCGAPYCGKILGELPAWGDLFLNMPHGGEAEDEGDVERNETQRRQVVRKVVDYRNEEQDHDHDHDHGCGLQYTTPRETFDDLQKCSECTILALSETNSSSSSSQTPRRCYSYSSTQIDNQDPDCDAIYCSQACAQRDWDQGHKLTCASTLQNHSSKRSQYAQLKTLSKKHEKYESLLYVYDIISRTLATQVFHESNNEKIKGGELFQGWLGDLCYATAWYEFTQGNEKRRRKIWKVLDQASQLISDLLENTVTSQDVSRILSILDLNSISVSLHNPLAGYCQALSTCANTHGTCLPISDAFANFMHECQSRLEFQSSNVESTLDAHGLNVVASTSNCIFEPIDCIALYSTISMVNHSCRPNVQLIHSVDSELGLITKLVALENIPANKELFISYIDHELPTAQLRQMCLDAYGFTCRCENCTEELGQSSTLENLST